MTTWVNQESFGLSSLLFRLMFNYPAVFGSNDIIDDISDFFDDNPTLADASAVPRHHNVRSDTSCEQDR